MSEAKEAKGNVPPPPSPVQDALKHEPSSPHFTHWNYTVKP